jgi:hypothetical protein
LILGHEMNDLTSLWKAGMVGAFVIVFGVVVGMY